MIEANNRRTGDAENKVVKGVIGLSKNESKMEMARVHMGHTAGPILTVEPPRPLSSKSILRNREWNITSFQYLTHNRSTKPVALRATARHKASGMDGIPTEYYHNGKESIPFL